MTGAPQTPPHDAGRDRADTGIAPVPRAGRPKASSRQTLAEAACELFLERGYAETSVADITRRAGVSRSSFFNYFSAKSDVLWAGFDERLDAAADRLADPRAAVGGALHGIGAGFAPDSLALAVANAEAMGLADELARGRALRHGVLAAVIAARLHADGMPPLAAEVRAAAAAGAVLSAVWAWIDAGAGTTTLSDILDEALSLALPE